MPMIQIFGMKNSAATRAAERFLEERRAQIQMIVWSSPGGIAAPESRTWIYSAAASSPARAFTPSATRMLRT